MSNNLGFGGPSSNPYLDKSVSDALGDTTKAYNMTTAPAYTSAMVKSGSFGNSGLAEAQQESERQLQTSLGRQANDMRSNNYQFGMNFDNQNYWRNQDFDRGVYNDSFAQNQQQFQNGIGLMDRQNQYNTQDLGFGTQIQNTPMNYYQGFANTANGLGQGFGTSTGSTNMSGSPLVGAIGGAQLGAQFGRSMGWGNNSMGNSSYGGGDPYAQYGYGVGGYLGGNSGSGG